VENVVQKYTLAHSTLITNQTALTATTWTYLCLQTTQQSGLENGFEKT